MDILEKFLNNYSYKFEKGYPDMNNDQDVLLLESILEELGVNLDEVRTLQRSQLKKRKNVDTFVEMFYSQTPFTTDDGDVILNKITIESDLFDVQDKSKEDILKTQISSGKGQIQVSGKYVSTNEPFNGSTGKLHKTGQFGGKSSSRGSHIEEQELAYINDIITQNGGKIDILLGDKIYTNITKAIKIKGNKQADFELTGDENLYIQHKEKNSQQLSGIHKLNLLTVEELTNDELIEVEKQYPEIQDFVNDIKKLKPNGLTNKDNFSRFISKNLQIKAAYGIGKEFGPDLVQAVFFGNLELKHDETNFILSSPKYFIYPELLIDDYRIMITVTYRSGMNQQGVKNARFGFYPKKNYPKTTFI
jgi:hypothetical protein